MRILIFRGGAIGDFILTLPALRVLRQAWPQVAVTLVGHPHIAELASIAGLIDRVLDIDAARFSAYFVPEPPLPLQESDFIRSFDLVISYLHDPHGTLRSNLIRSGARQVVSVSPQVTSGHAADHFLSALAPLGVPCPDSEFSGWPRGEGHASSRSPAGWDIPCSFRATPWVPLDLPSDLQSAGRTKLAALGLQGPVIAIHPGSGSVRKNWPLRSFLDLAEKIQQARLGRVLWIVGEADAAMARSLEAGKVGVRPVLKGSSLQEVASVLSQCRGYAGNDSGISHLAALVGIPTVALFGPTDPAVWGPRGRKVSILRGRPATTAGLARITVEDVYRKLAAVV